MLNPKIIFLVNDWVYNSPFFGRAVKLAGFYPVSSGIENGVTHLQKKVDQGYSLMAFPEGTRSYTHKMKRFHKGAFYLAHQFKLDVVPVIIHGNSEILPKGNFVIKRGRLSVKILKRIAFDDTSFGITDRERTKQISAHFKSEFKAFRKAHENATYFHNMVLEEFRYKGHEQYLTIKTDLNTHQDTYKYLLDTLEDDESITHISNAHGQLDFLLAVDSPNRKISSFLENSASRKLVQNSFIPNNHYKINSAESILEALKTPSNTLIINSDVLTNTQLESLSAQNTARVVLLFESTKRYLAIFEKLNYHISHQTQNLILLIKALI